MFRFTIRDVLWLMVVVGMSASLCDIAFAQEKENESAYSHLKVLEPLIGTWRRTNEPPTGGNMFVAEWIIDGSYIGVRLMREEDGSRTVESMTMIYWNEKLQRIESHGFARSNTRIDSTWSVESDTIVEKPLETDNATIKRKVEGDTLNLTMIFEGVPPIEFAFVRSPRPPK